MGLVPARLATERLGKTVQLHRIKGKGFSNAVAAEDLKLADRLFHRVLGNVAVQQEAQVVCVNGLGVSGCGGRRSSGSLGDRGLLRRRFVSFNLGFGAAMPLGRLLGYDSS